ncbi:MAG: hypothetical protein EBZ48_02030 [Proteobacteria bacterium]|nr:hypothetical protein [Pseudomonadota bacterium]
MRNLPGTSTQPLAVDSQSITSGKLGRGGAESTASSARAVSPASAVTSASAVRSDAGAQAQSHTRSSGLPAIQFSADASRTYRTAGRVEAVPAPVGDQMGRAVSAPVAVERTVATKEKGGRAGAVADTRAATVELSAFQSSTLRTESPTLRSEPSSATAISPAQVAAARSAPRLSVAAQGVQRLGERIEHIAQIPLIKGEITKAAALEVMRHHPKFKAAAMVVHAASPLGPTTPEIPFDLLSRLVAATVANRALGVEKIDLVVVNELPDSARVRKDIGDRSLACRKMLEITERFVPELNKRGFNIEARLGSDLTASRGYQNVQRDVAPLASKTYAVAHQDACIVETLRRELGPLVHHGWTSMDSLKQYEQVQQGAAGANNKYVRYHSMPVHDQLERFKAAETLFVPSNSGLAVSPYGLVATHPDLVTAAPQPFGKSPAFNGERLLLNHNDEQTLQRIFRDTFSLDPVGQRALIMYQSHVWQTLMCLMKISPQLLDHPRALLAELDVAERVVQLWRHEVIQATQSSAAQANAHLWQSMLAAANIRSEVLKHYVRKLLEELGVERTDYTAEASVMVAVPAAAATLTPARSLMLSDDTFEGSVERRGTMTLNADFTYTAAA